MLADGCTVGRCTHCFGACGRRVLCLCFARAYASFGLRPSRVLRSDFALTMRRVPCGMLSLCPLRCVRCGVRRQRCAMRRRRSMPTCANATAVPPASGRSLNAARRVDTWAVTVVDCGIRARADGLGPHWVPTWMSPRQITVAGPCTDALSYSGADLGNPSADVGNPGADVGNPGAELSAHRLTVRCGVRSRR